MCSSDLLNLIKYILLYEFLYKHLNLSYLHLYIYIYIYPFSFFFFFNDISIDYWLLILVSWFMYKHMFNIYVYVWTHTYIYIYIYIHRKIRLMFVCFNWWTTLMLNSCSSLPKTLMSKNSNKRKLTITLCMQHDEASNKT